MSPRSCDFRILSRESGIIQQNTEINKKKNKQLSTGNPENAACLLP